MKLAVAVHTAARRYCLERYAFWADRYSEILRCGRDRESDGYHYSPESLSTFPRYNVLNAIRVELERIDPAELNDFNFAVELTINAGQMANDDTTSHPISVIASQVIAEERAAFCGYIHGLTAAELAAVESLPYRRVLTAIESESLWSRLRERWHITDDYWYPLVETTLPGLVAFVADAFREYASPSQLQSILKNHGILRVWELREYGPEYQQEIAFFNPYYTGVEGYWSSDSLDWIVYASHECSVTLGGWLLDEVKMIWPSWQTHLWRGCY